MIASRMLARALAIVLLLGVAARAQEAYYVVALKDLNVGPQKMDFEPADRPGLDSAQPRTPWASLDGEGEAWVMLREEPLLQRDGTRAAASEWAYLAVRTPAARDVTGFVALPDGTGRMHGRSFRIGASSAKGPAAMFHRARLAHYTALRDREVPGAAWFRHQARQSEQALGRDLAEAILRGRPAPHELVATYDLFTGGRALSENLQLDRVLPPATQPSARTIKSADIAGITVAELDFRPLITGLSPKLDPLASAIPADQHAIFFPSFAAAIALIDEADRHGTPVLQLLEPRAEDAQTKQRYQKQLCLSLTGVGRLIGPHVIKSMAITGSDPYLRTGSDVALLFEARDPAGLRRLLSAQVAVARQAHPEAQPVSGQVDGIAYTGARSPDRIVCSYMAELGNSIAVTNSLAQLQRLVTVHKKQAAALAGLPEFTYFRHRYPLGEADETAFLYLSDPTIRRWCSSRWRIGDSRRTRAAGILAELQARCADELARSAARPRSLAAPWPIEGECALAAAGVVNSVYGSPDFLTPIVELDLDRISEPEEEAYLRWRDSYQRNWSWAFDPIAARFTLRPDRLGLDLTVMPLIGNTEYRQLMDVTRGARIGPDGGDRHDALGQVAMAINPRSDAVRKYADLAKAIAPGLTFNVLSWLGSSVSVFVDDDPFWAELATDPKPTEFLEKNIGRMPIGFFAEVDSGLKLAAFMAALRLFIAQSAPDLTQWDTLEHRELKYVKVSPTQKGRQSMDRAFADSAIYYTASGHGLLVTPNEALLKRFIDRRLARNGGPATATTTAPATRPAQPWLGDSIAAHADRRLLEVLASTGHNTYAEMMQARAWGNLPILNEYRRLYPQQDPLAVHQKLWGSRLLCPGGGTYRWNEAWRTMESTVYGHPGEPKTGPSMPEVLKQFHRASAGITFEPSGLRARAIVERAP